MPTTLATDNYYRASAPALHHDAGIAPGALQGSLRGEQLADVCIIGAGVAGCSAALHLAQRGYKVIVLEAEVIGAGASGRSGGQILPGYASGQSVLSDQLGEALTTQLWHSSVAAVQLTTQLIQQHHIDCDLQFGHLDTAVKPRQIHELRAMQRSLADYGYDTQLLTGNALFERVASTRYCAGLYDPASAHLHPLRYTLGLARAAMQAGVVFYEHSKVAHIQQGSVATVHTQHGSVRAAQVVLCANVGHGALNNKLNQRIMKVATYIVATEPLSEAQAHALLPHNDAVADVNFILDYFRRSADHRLLFGGRVSYSGHDFYNTAEATRTRMVQVFPQLKHTRIDYSWGGHLDITFNRAPDFGRLSDNVYYLQGFCGHGMALAGLAGQLVAETIAGQRERFDVYTRLKHLHFPGGAWLRTPALVLGMLWYRLRDVL